MTSPSACYVIIGLGQTGVSCAEYLDSIGMSFFIVDSRENPPGLNRIRCTLPDINIYTGISDACLLTQADFMIVSPGLPIDTPMIQEALQAGVKLLSDIDLFCQAVDAPIVGITGSNGKSTVTALMGVMAEAAGVNAVVAGNIGVPVLDLLKDPPRDLYIFELSSFQLERTTYLKPTVSALLNLSPDHLDVHRSFEAYRLAKHRIFNCCTAAIFNQEDVQTWPEDRLQEHCFSFTSGQPESDQFGIISKKNVHWLAFGDERLLAASEMRMMGFHNLVNATAALTIGRLLHFPLPAMLKALCSFSGLPHRCQWVANKLGADWFNDSKGTNEAASISAINGLAFPEKKGLILIAGGDGKGADFHEFAAAINRHVSQVILLGRDAHNIERAINGITPVHNVSMLEDAVICAGRIVKPGERVLLSPACTSWDMFSSYQERGELFMKQVNNLLDK